MTCGTILLAALLGPEVCSAHAAGQRPESVHGAWTVAAHMLAPIQSHRAVALHDGRVLVVGGEPVFSGWPVPWVQIYDPSSQIWSAAPSMHVARIGHTVTVLQDGRVLVVGGIGPGLKDLNSAEVFDPQTQTWQLLAPLPQERFSHSAALLPDGRVLIVGGIVNGTIARTTLLFDPNQNRFLPGPATHHLHALHHALTLDDGSVLVTGGYGGGTEIYDPRSNRWTITGVLPPRYNPIATVLANGRVLVASGATPAAWDLKSARIFIPARGAWVATAPLHVRRDTAAGTLLANGQVLVAGGQQTGYRLLRSAELYDPTSQTWMSAGQMHEARTGATATRLRNGTVLVCGGVNLDGVLASCELYSP